MRSYCQPSLKQLVKPTHVNQRVRRSSRDGCIVISGVWVSTRRYQHILCRPSKSSCSIQHRRSLTGLALPLLGKEKGLMDRANSKQAHTQCVYSGILSSRRRKTEWEIGSKDGI